MKIKRVLASPYCWLTVRIRVPYEHVENIRYLCEAYKYKTAEKYIQDLVIEKIEAEKEIIDQQRQKDIEEEKRADEVWRHWLGQE